MDNRDVQCVLQFLGIDPEDFLPNPDDADDHPHFSEDMFSGYQQKIRSIQYRKLINRLMNITLQVLGTIRLMVNELEKIRISLDCTDIDGSFRDSGVTNYLQRQLFVQSIKTLGDTILVGKEIDYHDPMKDLIDSFPWEYSLTQHKDSHWLLLDWALMAPYLSRLYSTENNGTTDYLQSPLILQLEKEKSLHYSSLIKNILKLYPVAITEIDKFGQHYLTYLIRASDIIIAEKNTPITSNHSLLEDVIHYHKNCCKLYDGKGKLAIHYAAHYSQSVETLLMIGEGMNKPLTDIMFNTMDDLGNLPLHHACYGNCSLAVFREILFNYPDAVKVKNNQDSLPIHILAQYAFAPISSASTSAVSPAHPSMSNSGPVSQIPTSPPISSVVADNLEKFRLLISSYPQGLETLDGNGLIPLQIACFYNKSFDYIQFLYEHFRSAISRPSNETGRLPLHYNTVYCYSSKIMKYLIDLYPDAVKVMDYNQRLPLHTLIARTEYMTPSRIRCLRLLIEEYPYAASMRDKDGQTPLDLARRNELGDLVIRLLLRADPSQDPIALGELAYLASQTKYGGEEKEDPRQRSTSHHHHQRDRHGKTRPPKPSHSRPRQERRKERDHRSRRKPDRNRRYSRESSRQSTYRSRNPDTDSRSYYDDKDQETNTFYDSYDSEGYDHYEDGKNSDRSYEKDRDTARDSDYRDTARDSYNRDTARDSTYRDSARDSLGGVSSQQQSGSYFNDEYSSSHIDQSSQVSIDDSRR